jgi:DNA-binding response OmpR family regulator
MSQHVLVVDDSPTVRRVVGRTLTQAGYRVTLAIDGRDALDKVHTALPDLVLVDFVMPQMNGLRFVQAMRQVANLATVPVVLMSAKADKIGDGFVAQTGALDAITKPFSPEALLAVTGHALSRWATVRESQPPSVVPTSAVSVLPPSSEPPPETSPAALAAAARSIADRVAALVATQVAGVDREALGEQLAQGEPEMLFALARDVAAMVPGQDGELALEGRLEHVPLGEILQLVTHQRQTGVLEIEKQPSRSGRRVTICLKDGAVQLALGAVDEEEFRLGRYLLREGLLEREDLERIVRHRTPGRGLLGTHLVKLGYISADELSRVLVQQTSELIYEALRWRRGRYRFVRFASRPEAVDAHLGLPLASILMEGLRRVDEWRLIEEQLQSFDDVPRRDEQALSAVDVMRLSPDERRVLDAVDGQRTVRAIVEHVRLSSFDACKILFQLLTSRLLRVPARGA